MADHGRPNPEPRGTSYPRTIAPRPVWSFDLRSPCQGLMLAREKKWTLSWDEQSWLYLLDPTGAVQAQRRFSSGIAAASAADDGSAFAVVSGQGDVDWLAPDLMSRWQESISNPALAAALDPLGQYLLVSDQSGSVHCFDRLGRVTVPISSPRPLHHLAFVPEAPLIVGCADFGLIGCFDLMGQWCWRHGPVAHIGALAVSSQHAVTACYTQGLQYFGLNARWMPPPPVTWPCRHVALTFDGQLALTSWVDRQLHLVGPEGQKLATMTVDDVVAALALHALGEAAVVALASGRILQLRLI